MIRLGDTLKVNDEISKVVAVNYFNVNGGVEKVGLSDGRRLNRQELIDGGVTIVDSPRDRVITHLEFERKKHERWTDEWRRNWSINFGNNTAIRKVGDFVVSDELETRLSEWLGKMKKFGYGWEETADYAAHQTRQRKEEWTFDTGSIEDMLVSKVEWRIITEMERYTHMIRIIGEESVSDPLKERVP